MNVLPVLDLRNDVVVRGIAGRRSEYRPRLIYFTASCRSLGVARALRRHFGFTELYVADLNAIQGATPVWKTLDRLQANGFRLWVDAGVVKCEDAVALHHFGVSTVVVGLETVAGPEALAAIVQALGDQVVFSLDLQAGVPLGNLALWKQQDAASIAAEAVALGVRRLLLLDLTRVGMNEGTGTLALCMQLATTFPNVERSAGGGVRGMDDLGQLRDCGVQNVLVASALYDGRLTPSDLAAL